ncbi:hypothetical protein LPJ66_004564 [Kickxella alabastrina]|uniref:Uncharacterized protein n=1 Tax=Kickxella alabastrina TaxID=61397 RepID=A0ACC1IGN6_9FUNG|nr:hypothetical protein LPJ66_004564 [Kickxella alabastrina]
MGTELSLMTTSSDMQGVVPRAINEIWNHLENRSNTKAGFTYSVDISFLELHNEDLVDLLNPRSAAGSRGPTIREDSRGNMVLVGVERKPASHASDILGFLHQGALSRTTASTDMNHTSSRSHAIFTIFLRQQDRRSSAMLAGGCASPTMNDPADLDGGPSIVSKIHFVDLAGSERIKRTGAAGDRAKEGISINAGLLALGNVISALGSSSSSPSNQQQSKRPMHVPYRDSKLTRLLQDSLGGNSQTVMLACISPSDRNNAESLNTIRYANRARNIRNKVAVNFDKNSSVELSMLKTEVARLRGELSKLKLMRRQSTLSLTETGGDPSSIRALEAEVGRLQRKNAEITQKLEHAVRRAAVLNNECEGLRSEVINLGGAVLSTALAEDPMMVDDYGNMMSQNNVLNTLNHELSEQAERHEQQIDSVRRHYESKLELMQEALSIVNKERDVALQRLANAGGTEKDSASVGVGTPNRSEASSQASRRNLGLDNTSSSTIAAPTKLRIPSRMAKGARPDGSTMSTPVSRKSSSAELRLSRQPQLSRLGSSLGITTAPVLRDDSMQLQQLQDEVAQLKLNNKQSSEGASAESEKLTLQIQEQAKEISRLRRQHTGRRESKRYSLLSFKENSSWAVAKNTLNSPACDDKDGPNLLRAAFIKAVLENELNRCVRARQLLRERDSFVNKQDELMTEQTDLMLQIQCIELEADDGYRQSQVQRLNERIEIIDAELRYLDLKVRDAEADVAQLAEADASDSTTDLSASGLLTTPMIINMSGLAMRMVEDVVRIDYRAFADLFEHLSQRDSTGLAYLFMQDIIEHRLVALRDEQERTTLEEQSMDLRRTLLAMQKTALNAALTYERELGDAERKLNTLQSPSASMYRLAENGGMQVPNYLGTPNGNTHAFDGSGYGRREITGGANNFGTLEPLPERSVYEGVRDRGILLRSALMSSMESEPLSPQADNEYPLSDAESNDDGDDNEGEGVDDHETDIFSPAVQAAVYSRQNVSSMEDIRGAKAAINDLADDTPDFSNESLFREGTLRGRRARGWVEDSLVDSFALRSVDSLGPSVVSEDETPDSIGMDANVFEEDTCSGVGRGGGSAFRAQLADMVLHDDSQQSSPVSLAPPCVKAPTVTNSSAPSDIAQNDTSSTLHENQHRHQDSPDQASFAASGASLSIEPRSGFNANEDDHDATADFQSRVLYSDTASGNDSDSEGEVPELYNSSSGEFFRLPNLARNQSIRSRGRRHQHLVRRSSARKQITRILAITPRIAKKTSVRRPVALRKSRISLPIVPPEMIEYIDKRNPRAISVGPGSPMVASPELLRNMHVPINGEYQSNIAAIASFSVNKSRSSTALSPIRTTAQTCNLRIPGRIIDQSSATSSGVVEKFETFKDALDATQSDDIGGDNTMSPALASMDSGIVCLPIHAPMPANNSSIAMAAMSSFNMRSHSPLSTPISLYNKNSLHLHQAPLSYSSNVADSSLEMGENNFRLAAADMQTSPHMRPFSGMSAMPRPRSDVYIDLPSALSMQRSMSALSNHSSYERERIVSRIGTPLRSPQPHRYLSPTEQTNASLFSMMDAARPDYSRVTSPYSDEHQAHIQQSRTGAGQLISFDSTQTNGKEQSEAKATRIRRRAHTAFDSGLDLAKGSPGNRQSTFSVSDKAPVNAPAAGSSRLSKLLSGIGLGGKLKQQAVDATSRERSNSDSTGTRLAHVLEDRNAVDGGNGEHIRKSLLSNSTDNNCSQGRFGRQPSDTALGCAEMGVSADNSNSMAAPSGMVTAVSYEY